MEAGGGSALRQGTDEGSEQQSNTIRWKPNEHCLQLLLAMGIDRNAAIKGLYYTGNHSAEFAASYVFDNPDIDDEFDGALRVESHTIESDEEASEIPHFKMVFVVNAALGMGIGKTAAQVGHASLALFQKLIADQKRFSNALLMWEEEGQKKVVLRGEDVSHLKQIEKKAQNACLASCTIEDAGRTEVPSGSVTVLAVFGQEEFVNEVTGHLPLL